MCREKCCIEYFQTETSAKNRLYNQTNLVKITKMLPLLIALDDLLQKQETTNDEETIDDPDKPESNFGILK